MKNKCQDIITKMVDVLKVSDKKSTQLLLTLMLDSSGDINIQKQLKGLITKPNFNKLLRDMLNQDFLGRDIEWVLVIPLKKYMNNSNNLYELIFGIGQEITKRDMFLIWNNENKKGKILLLNLKHDEKRRDIMSLHELHNIATDYGLDRQKEQPHQKPIRYATIENIKEYLELMLKDKGRGILKSYEDNKFLLKLQHLKTEFRYLNITINILKDASLILLKDVYDPRHNIKQESLGYDPYSVVRSFLRFIRMHTETRGGTEERFRLSNDNLDLVDHYIKFDNDKNDKILDPKTKTPTKKQKTIYIYEVLSEVLERPVKHLSPHSQEKLLALLNKYL